MRLSQSLINLLVLLEMMFPPAHCRQYRTPSDFDRCYIGLRSTYSNRDLYGGFYTTIVN